MKIRYPPCLIEGSLLELDNRGILDGRFTPSPPIAPAPGQFGIADLLVFAGVASYPG